MEERGIRKVKLTSEMKNSFMQYAMSVIVSRALPDVRDGLKPVQRRIIYGMSDLGCTPGTPYKKSARIVGEVMGKYHPHGDSSIYEALVRMAQDFSYRYMLVDGHGNFGSIDGDGAAAQRYTEARMSKISSELVRDLKEDTIDSVDKTVIVKISVSDGHEQVSSDQPVDGCWDFFAFRAQAGCYFGKSLGHINQQVLQISGFRFFTADTSKHTAFIAGCFLTLKTKHFRFHNITPYNYGDFLLLYCGCCHNGRVDKYFFHVYDIIITV